MSTRAQSVLYVVACGGRPAADLLRLIRHAQAREWDVCVIATPSAMKFLDPVPLAALTGHPVRSDYKRPDEPDALPAPDAFIVVPATFNTINKLAAGISDTLALGLLNEAIGTGLPVIAVPFPNQMLARHPVFTASITALRSWGVRLVFDPDRYPLPVPNQGEPGSSLFPWVAAMAELDELRTRNSAPDDASSPSS
jgi:phosphopantothenoylcysteine synthetase/decarboxylase